MVNIPSLQEMLSAGLHFGHQLSKKHPKMDDYVYTSRQRVAIIDLEKTSAHLQKAVDFVKRIAAGNGVVLFIGSKRQAQAIMQAQAERCFMPYVNNRWLGGTFTNFGSMSKLIKKYKKLKEDRDKGEFVKYTKKEQLDFTNEIKRLDVLVGGLETLDRLPQAIFVVDIKKEKTAVAEANAMNIPVIAIVDSNTNPTNIDWPIPANDDATKGIEMITGLIANAVLEGKTGAK